VYETFTLYGHLFHGVLLLIIHPISEALQPPACAEFRLFRFRSPLLTESLLISFPHPTEMFQFGWYPAYCYDNLATAFTTDYSDKSEWVAPFGNRRIDGL
jgi:hypothetical protein